MFELLGSHLRLTSTDGADSSQAIAVGEAVFEAFRREKVKDLILLHWSCC